MMLRLDFHAKNTRGKGGPPCIQPGNNKNESRILVCTHFLCYSFGQSIQTVGITQDSEIAK